jgi:dTDP-4-amino-4,6-dideoxygalactose transaminase
MTSTQPEPIPMWLPHIGPETVRAATDALEIGYLGMGAATKEFEDALADYLELPASRALMSTNSCTAALNCACLLAGAGPGTEVIAPRSPTSPPTRRSPPPAPTWSSATSRSRP